MAESFTDRDFHKAAPVPATGRPSIYDCRRPERDWVGHLFDNHAPLPAGGVVLDAGCGPGIYAAAARQRVGTGTLVALDSNADHGRMHYKWAEDGPLGSA